MKRLKYAIIIFIMLSLTGCVKKYTITEEQNDAIAEYVAGVILENDKDYDQELVSSDESEDNNSEDIAGDITQVPANDSSGNTSGESEPSGGAINPSSNLYSLTQVIGASDFQINYKSYEFMNTYSSNEYFELNPSENHKLLVITFEIENASKEKQVLNLIKDTDIEYKLYINSTADDTQRLLTFLENDLKYIKMSFDAGETKKALLIFEVPSSTKVSSMELVVTNGEKSTTVKLK